MNQSVASIKKKLTTMFTSLESVIKREEENIHHHASRLAVAEMRRDEAVNFKAGLNKLLNGE